MKKRILSALTSLALVALVALALIFVPFDANSDSDAESLSNDLSEQHGSFQDQNNAFDRFDEEMPVRRHDDSKPEIV